MIDLLSDRWNTLTHAYGDADDLPVLLQRLAAGDAAVMSELFGSVCHQGSIYDASYAVVPHLVAIAGVTKDPSLRAEILILCGAIRASKDDRSLAKPADDVLREFAVAIPVALELAIATLQQPIEPDTAVYLLQAAAALKGYWALGRLLSGFLDREFYLTCPECDRDLYVWPDDQGFFVAAEDPVSAPQTRRTPVVAGPIQSPEWRPQYEWLVGVAGPSALSRIGGALPFLFGQANCPACQQSFLLLKGMGERA